MLLATIRITGSFRKIRWLTCKWKLITLNYSRHTRERKSVLNERKKWHLNVNTSWYGWGKRFKINFLLWQWKKKNTMFFCHKCQDKYCYLLGYTGALYDFGFNHNNINGRSRKKTWVCNSLFTVLAISSPGLPGLYCMVTLKGRSKQGCEDTYAVEVIFLSG